MRQKVLDLRPTQLTVGMREVELRVKKLRGLSSKELDEFLHERRVPVVRGPRERLFVIDRHHLIRACWECGIEEVPVEMKADLSHLDWKELWKAMHAAHWMFVFDQFGNGPHDPAFLPENVRGLADDPYRSLAWLVRREGGFDKTETPFVEFEWAGFFRKALKTHPTLDHFDEAAKEALALAKTPACAHLPGYAGK